MWNRTEWLGLVFFSWQTCNVSVRAWGFVRTLFMSAVADVGLHVGNFLIPEFCLGVLRCELLRILPQVLKVVK
jgi:hypothetical protein